jgi:hypothetical protein
MSAPGKVDISGHCVIERPTCNAVLRSVEPVSGGVWVHYDVPQTMLSISPQ